MVLFTFVFIVNRPLAQTTPNDCADCSPEQKALYDRYRTVEKGLKTALAGGGCSADLNQGSLCEYKDVCSQFGANATEANTYRNAQGQSIPNYAFRRMLDKVKTCFLNDFETKSTPDPEPAPAGAPGTAGKIPSTRAGEDSWYKKQVQASKAVLDSVAKNKEEVLYLHFAQFQNEEALKNADQPQGAFGAPPDPSGATKVLDEFEAKEGKKFSAETRSVLMAQL
ncbi:MAG: hypothetical protein EBX52_09275 [Proteobacteria bacterium]|nr:hypothetical protein [Pseudomonadota bacterium]